MWDNENYEFLKEKFRKEIKPGEEKKYFKLFDRMVAEDEFETAKAIRDVMIEMKDAIKKTKKLLGE